MDAPMNSIDFHQASEDYQRIERAIRYIEANATRQPELEEVAASLNLSEYHFQRLFTRWAGISPKRFLQFLTKESAKDLLAHSSSLLEATYETGLSSPGRLHDLFIQTEAVTPGEYKSHGEGIEIRYGFHQTQFGECLLAMTERGICWLAFVLESRMASLEELKDEWVNARFSEDPQATAPLVRQIFQKTGTPAGKSTGISLHLKGTNFQIKVWEALLNLPEGHATTYESLSTQLGCTRGARAVGNAVGRNPVAFLIPCHRVLKKNGEIGNYRYGEVRKKAILGWEMARRENPPA
jgi:AraC family transcriptional regulator of adaptative response/methylated-DNA-[protein]-cysteine methyltransferase